MTLLGGSLGLKLNLKFKKIKLVKLSMKGSNIHWFNMGCGDSVLGGGGATLNIYLKNNIWVIFLGGLQPEIKHWVQIFQPITRIQGMSRHTI
ncbi:hypothetical protein CR513_41065, partial [Mucuna pruriens]